MDLIQSLKNIGLNEKEARVYVALLQTTKATAYTVAKLSGLKKPTTYVILEELIDKGIVSKIPRVNTSQYLAISPQDLFSLVRGKLDNAEKEALPELKALSRGKEYKVRASYFEGIDGIKEMYNKLHQEMAGKEYIGFFAHTKDTPPKLLELFDEIREKHKKLKICQRAITVQDSRLKEFFNKDFCKRHDIKPKTLPIEKYNSNISLEIYKNYTQIISHRHLQGIIIDNPDIAHVLRQIFELIWERGDALYPTK